MDCFIIKINYDLNKCLEYWFRNCKFLMNKVFVKMYVWCMFLVLNVFVLVKNDFNEILKKKKIIKF